jgi:hypothetical protein
MRKSVFFGAALNGVPCWKIIGALFCPCGPAGGGVIGCGGRGDDCDCACCEGRITVTFIRGSVGESFDHPFWSSFPIGVGGGVPMALAAGGCTTIVVVLGAGAAALMSAIMGAAALVVALIVPGSG